MIDSHFRTPWQKFFFEPCAKTCNRLGLRPNHLTYAAMLFGILCAYALSCGHQFLAIMCLLLSGLCDATDGTLARLQNHTSDSGCLLDITGDRLVEASVVVGLYCYAPATRGLLCLILLSSFYLCITTFLLSGIFEKNQSNKSFHYSAGLIERSETFAFFVIVIIWDQSFFISTMIFSGLVFFTAFKRLFEMYSLVSQTSCATKFPQAPDGPSQATTNTVGPPQ